MLISWSSQNTLLCSTGPTLAHSLEDTGILLSSRLVQNPITFSLFVSANMVDQVSDHDCLNNIQLMKTPLIAAEENIQGHLRACSWSCEVSMKSAASGAAYSLASTIPTSLLGNGAGEQNRGDTRAVTGVLEASETSPACSMAGFRSGML